MNKLFPSPSLLRIARFIQGISQEELARRVERSRGWISSVERGVHKARIRNTDAERIAAVLGRSVEEIFPDIGKGVA